MNIMVLGTLNNLESDKWSDLWEMLDAAKEAGVEYTKYTYQEDEYLKADAFIWIDIDKPKYYGAKPYIELSSLLDTFGTTEQKVQLLASYMFGKKDCPTPISHVSALVDEANDPACHEFTIDIADLGYQVTPEEVAKLTIKEFIVSIEGKEVNLGRDDLVVLGKVANLMDKFGYKVKKVVV